MKNKGDILGGLAAMLVALPSAIAFGVVVYSPLGSKYAADGAMAGIIGTIAIGLVASMTGATARLISAPCAPAAAVLGAMVGELVKSGESAVPPETIPFLITLVALMAGGLQVLFGILGGGKIIKYIPYPVVAGYLSSVGILIVIGQLPKLLGLGRAIPFWDGILSPHLWSTPAVAVGVVSIVVMLFSPRITKAIPATILAVSVGLITYFLLSFVHPELATLTGNSLVIGPIETGNGGILPSFVNRWVAMTSVRWQDIANIATPTLTLAVLLSIDTLKTCVVLDNLTRSRSNSNRTLIGQGLGNITAAFTGGMPGAGTLGPTLVNFTSGGVTARSGVIEGLFALAAFLILGKLVAWVPVAALAGIMIVVGFRMVDRNIFRLILQRSTRIDFAVVGAVVLTAVLLNLMAAAGVGLALSILLFLREQIRSTVIHRRALGNKVFSKKRRLPAEIAILEAKGDQTCVFELQGSLFFGTTDQLFSELEPYLVKAKYVILDMRRIQSVDFSATHKLEQIEVQLEEHGGCLIFSNIPSNLPSGQDLRSYFEQVGLTSHMEKVKTFAELDDALEWTEDQLLQQEYAVPTQNLKPLELGEIDVLKGLSPDALNTLRSCAVEKTFSTGQKIFSHGELGDELFLVRQGTVRIELPLGKGKSHHLASFSRGDFFGDMSFLDKRTRSADALAATDVSLFLVSRAGFDQAASQHEALGGMVFAHLAYVLAVRLRHTDAELRALEES